MTSEFEVGMNLQILQTDVFGIDAAITKPQKRKTRSSLFRPIRQQGFSYMVTNFGEVSNKGIEVVINTTPVQIKDFRWDLSFNFSKNNNKVLSLPESLEGGKVSIHKLLCR